MQRPTDQAKFDAEVNRNGGMFLQVLGAVGIMTAIGIATLALVVASQNHTSAMVMPSEPVAAAPSAPVAQTVSLSVAGSIKKGPDGKMHDAFSETNFAVKVGQPTRMRIDNRDASPHSITAIGYRCEHHRVSRSAHLHDDGYQSGSLRVDVRTPVRQRRSRLGDDPSRLDGRLHHRDLSLDQP